MEILKKFCRKACFHTFENSESGCIEKHANYNKNTTLQKINLQKEIQTYCQTHKNRFWILYYPSVEKEIGYLCWKCGSQEDKCKDYFLDRVIKHIKAFDVSQESVVFKALRDLLYKQVQPTQNQEIVFIYADKIYKNYEYKSLDIQKASVLIENALEVCNNVDYKTMINTALEAHKAYKVEVKLKAFCLLAFNHDKSKEDDFSKYVLEELMHQEKFTAYMKKIIHSRFIDFTRSKSYELIVSDEIEVHQEVNEVEEYDASLLQSLNQEQTVINKLKYGFKLDNKEFITVIIKLDYYEVDLLQDLTNEEKFYIKLMTKYALDDDSDQLEHFDVKSLKKSIHIKITQQREKLRSYSYSEYEESDKKEIYFKLLYAETLTSKEIAVIFDLTAKQIDKKIENSKKKLKSAK